jgi:hypothetical protein
MTILEAVLGKTMTDAQALAISRLLYNDEHVAQSRAGYYKDKADSFRAHSILSYVLTHMMSDDENMRYIKERLKLGE